MSKKTRIGELIIDLQLKTEALEKGLKTSQEKLKQMENNTQSNTVKFAAFSAAGVLALNNITNAIKSGIEAYVQYSNSIKGVQAIATHAGIALKDVNEAINNSNKYKLMDESDVTASIKNLISYGYTIKQTTELMDMLQDVAMDNKQAHYTFSQAVRVTTEGIRLENSVLSDAAGIQKNIAKMYDEHAKSLGKTTDVLTQAEKAQAVYNGIVAESEAYIGRAAEESERIVGQQAQYNASMLGLSRTIGESFAPALQSILSFITPLIKETTELVDSNKGLSASIVTLITSAGGLVLAFKGLAAIFPVLQAAMGPTGWIIAGVSLLVSVFVGLNAEVAETTRELEQMTKSMQNANKAIQNFKIDDDKEKANVQNELERIQAIIDEYTDLEDKLISLQSQYDYTLLHPTSADDTVRELARIKNETTAAEQRMKELANTQGMTIEGMLKKVRTYANALEEYNSKADTNSQKKNTNTTGVYKNTALENYKKQIEYKKNLDKISAEEEIQMYEYAYRRLAKTTDEKMDLEVKIYQLRKDLSGEYIANLESELEKRRQLSEHWIEEQKQLGELSVRQETEAYDRIIAYHKEYLDKILADMKISSEEKDRIWAQETKTMKSYLQKQRELQVENINNIYGQLTDAIVSNLEELQEKELDSLSKRRESLDKWKDYQIENINDVYDKKIQAINDELKALEKAEERKSRLEEQADYEKQKKRLEELIAFEHDAVTKASYEKELEKLNSEYKKTLEKQTLEDKKDALNNEIENLEDKKQSKIDAINDEYEKTKEFYDAIELETNTYYKNQIENANIQAQKMLLNAEENNDKIISLLEKYTDEYELIGSTWGEKLANAFESKVQGIISTIENLQGRINRAIDNKLVTTYAGATGSAYSGITGYEHINKNTTIVQNNSYNVEVERPSSLVQKQKDATESLAETIRRAI